MQQQDDTQISAIDLAIFIARVEAICQEMGTVLRRSALSPNIKDRLDFSCALFDAEGELFAQAAHIPVHLGSMAWAMRAIVAQGLDRDGVDANAGVDKGATRATDWQRGDMLVLNDPYLGGTHLPDVTLISPIFCCPGPAQQPHIQQPHAQQLHDQQLQDQQLIGFVANRAHHANIGAESPGSMPLSTCLEEEGVIIPPTLIARAGVMCQDKIAQIVSQASTELSGDLAAQMSANRVGLARFEALVARSGRQFVRHAIRETNNYGERLARRLMHSLPTGVWHFSDQMDDDGCGAENIVISVSVTLSEDGIAVDFRDTAEQVPGNINCPLSVAAAAVYYAVACILPAQTPACAGAFRAISISAPLGSLVNARRPAAVAAGNVETSMRIVDVVLGALAQVLPEQIPAASQGTMNNLAMGNHQLNAPWDYYETMAGGTGGHPQGAGVSCVHSHMTNTLNTPVESIEMHYPLRVREYSVRRGSGGAGRYPGGDGLCRELEFLGAAEVTLLTERRSRGPWGLAGGDSGKPGANFLDARLLPAKCQLSVHPGQVLRIESPGGGGFGGGGD